MSEATDGPGAFTFDPEQLDDIGDLAEAFIHEELDAALLDEINREDLQTVVEDGTTTDGTIEVDSEVSRAAVEIAELILERMNAVGK